MNDRRYKGHYDCISEASNAAQALGIKTMSEYKHRFKEDPRLPSNPNRQYSNDWTVWKEFLGTGASKYGTLEEAANSARQLGIYTETEYVMRWREDPKLTSSPDRRYKDSWVDWATFLGKDSKNFYKSIEEASDAVAKLGINSQTSYNRNYKKDGRLPSNPRSYYSDKWVDWYTFFKKDRHKYYATLNEASKAAILLGIDTGRKYHSIRKKDPKLHCDPHIFYKDEWLSWRDFLKTKIKKYATLEQASKAAIEIGFKTTNDYRTNYKKDPLLVSDPATYYASEWVGFSDFLNSHKKYKSLEEASKSAQRLGIKGISEYRKRFKEDSKLVTCPEIKYSKEWIDWYCFLNIERPLCMNKGWIDAKKRYLSKYASIDVRSYVLERFYTYYFKVESPTYSPAQLLHKERPFNVTSYQSFILSQTNINQKKYHSILSGFFDFVLEEYCSEDGENGDACVLAGFRNPLKTILREFDSSLMSRRPSESVRPVLPFVYIGKARSFLFPNPATSFRSLTHLHEFYCADWFDVDRKQIDESDLDCVWRVVGTRKKKVYQMWCPARAIAMFTLLRVPLRGQQILWLDSGEADSEIPIVSEGGAIKWVENKSILRKLRDKDIGFVRRLSDGTVGMFITTNKTSTIDKGYLIPYMPDDLAFLVIRLREWQSKYNALKNLTSWTEIRIPRLMSENLLKSRNQQTFLFRTPLGDKISPFNRTNTFWHYLPKILFNIQSKESPLATKSIDGSSKFRSEFSPHSLRVSLITAYVVDGDVPVHIISKLVGHTSIAMTIYYTKVGAGQMRKVLGEAEKRALSESTHRIEDLLLNKQIEQAKGELVAKDTLFFREIDESWPAASYQFSDKGICAMGGGACDSGGVGDDGESDGNPVPQGYLGRRNCVRCRYFVTGPAFVGGLQALANEISLEVGINSREYSNHEAEVQRLEDEKFDCEAAGKLFLKRAELSKAYSHFEEKAMILDMLLCDLLSTNKLIKQSIALINTQCVESDGKQLIVSGSLANLELTLEESNTDFRLLSQICENATIYSGASASRALPRRSQLLDRLADINGLSPAMYRLSQEQQLIVGNQLTKLLMSRIQSWDNMDRLMAGDILLDDLSDDETLEPLSKSVKILLDHAKRQALKGGN